MVEPSPPTETVVARVRTDAATAVRIQNGVAESWAGHVAAVAIAEEVDGHWSVAVHFGEQMRRVRRRNSLRREMTPNV